MSCVIFILVSLSYACREQPKNAESKSDSRRAEYFESQAEAVSRAIDDGRLGPRKELLVEMETAAKEETVVDEKSFKETVPRFFTPDGRLLPWKQMNEDQQDAFIVWINGSAKVQSTLGGEFTAIWNKLKLERTEIRD